MTDHRLGHLLGDERHQRFAYFAAQVESPARIGGGNQRPNLHRVGLEVGNLQVEEATTIAQTPLVGYRLIVLALLATGFISFGVWSHHMFATGMPTISISFFSAASMAVSVPAGLQVFSWIATLADGRIRWVFGLMFAGVLCATHA